MDISDIKELASIMREAGLASLEYSENGAAVKMTRNEENALRAADRGGGGRLTGAAPGDAAPADGSFIVTSPMVGVFYASPGEDREAFVSVGDVIGAGDTLCIIEAMKIMNEITADKAGIVSEICAVNRQVVEFGTPLFRMLPRSPGI